VSLSEQQQVVLQTIYDEFKPTGKWPTFQHLDIVLDQEQGLALEPVLMSLRPALVRVYTPIRPQSEVTLRIAGLAHCEESEEDLALFAAALGWTVAKERRFRPSSPFEAEQQIVTSEEARVEWGGAAGDVSELTLRKAYELLSVELLYDGQGSDGTSWQLHLSPRIRRFRGVRNYVDYLHLIQAEEPARTPANPVVSPVPHAAVSTQRSPASSLLCGTAAKPVAPDEMVAPTSARRHDGRVALSSKTIAALAKPFDHGYGPSHSTIELIWTAAGAEAYLPREGNKLDRVLSGLRALKNGTQSQGALSALGPNHEKLRLVASELATALVARNFVDEESVAEALEFDPQATEAPLSSGRRPQGSERVSSSSSSAVERADDPREVMVVHGRDSAARKAMFDWLRAIGLHPREWTELVNASKTASPFIGEVLDGAFKQAQAVVVLFTPDEHVQLRPDLAKRENEWRLQARPNVLLEAGMALGRHAKRTVLVLLGEAAMPSDLAGRHFVNLPSPESLRDLASRLEQAGCPVDLRGTDWLDSKRFPDRSAVSGQPTLQTKAHTGEQTAEPPRLIEQVMAAEIASALEKIEEVLPADGAPGSGTWPIGFANWWSTWATKRDQLASVFDQDSFMMLSRAYERLRELERGMEKGGQPLGDEDRAFFARAEHQLREASELLLSRSHP
jgi:predicted nucleotide-binding protein